MLRATSHDASRKTRGQDGVAFSFLVGLFHSLQHAGLSRRTLINGVSLMRSAVSRGFFIFFCLFASFFLLDQAHPCVCAGASLRWADLLPSSISASCPPDSLSPVSLHLFGVAHQTSLRSWRTMMS